jgi:hypothetical protein
MRLPTKRLFFLSSLNKRDDEGTQLGTTAGLNGLDVLQL